jgi:hypothetical protein
MHNARLHLCMCVCVCVRIRISVVTTQPRSHLSQYVCVKYKFAEITHRDRHIFNSSCGNSQGHRSQIRSESNQSNEYSTADAHPITARDSGFFFWSVSHSLCLCAYLRLSIFCVCSGIFPISPILCIDVCHIHVRGARELYPSTTSHTHIRNKTHTQHTHIHNTHTHTHTQVLRSLNHKNIIQLYEIFEEDGMLLMIMELCTGSRLCVA